MLNAHAGVLMALMMCGCDASCGCPGQVLQSSQPPWLKHLAMQGCIGFLSAASLVHIYLWFECLCDFLCECLCGFNLLAL